VLVGNARFLEDRGVEIRHAGHELESLMAEGHSVIHVAKDGRPEGWIVVGNATRPELSRVARWLRTDGVSRLCLLSGDSETVVEALARSAAIEESRGGLLPVDKAEYVERFESRGIRVAMVGDGVNDALALARATVGIAMGAGGSEVAVEAADLALVDDSLERIVQARRLSRRTLRVVEQNFWIANASNLSGALLGLGGLVTPAFAGLFHVAETLGVVWNSGRLLRWDIPGVTARGRGGPAASWRS
jgi:cation-transporting P-type ATPase C